MRMTRHQIYNSMINCQTTTTSTTSTAISHDERFLFWNLCRHIFGNFWCCIPCKLRKLIMVPLIKRHEYGYWLATQQNSRNIPNVQWQNKLSILQYLHLFYGAYVCIYCILFKFDYIRFQIMLFLFFFLFNFRWVQTPMASIIAVDLHVVFNLFRGGDLLAIIFQISLKFF